MKFLSKSSLRFISTQDLWHCDVGHDSNLILELTLTIPLEGSGAVAFGLWCGLLDYFQSCRLATCWIAKPYHTTKSQHRLETFTLTKFIEPSVNGWVDWYMYLNLQVHLWTLVLPRPHWLIWGYCHSMLLHFSLLQLDVTVHNIAQLVVGRHSVETRSAVSR